MTDRKRSYMLAYNKQWKARNPEYNARYMREWRIRNGRGRIWPANWASGMVKILGIRVRWRMYEAKQS